MLSPIRWALLNVGMTTETSTFMETIFSLRTLFPDHFSADFDQLPPCRVWTAPPGNSLTQIVVSGVLLRSVDVVMQHDPSRAGQAGTAGRETCRKDVRRSEEPTSALQSLMRISYTVF